MGFKSKKPRKKNAAILLGLFEEEHSFSKPKNRYEELTNKALKAYEEAPFRFKLRLRYAYRRELIRAIYHNAIAKEIHAKDLRIITAYTSDDYADTKYVERIKSPVTGIRAYCVNCQGGQIAAVRNCGNGGCPLFPFRMGSNPFYGKLANADADVTEDFEEEGEAVGN